MFRHQLDPIETGNPRYSERFDILLNLAEVDLYAIENEPDVEIPSLPEKSLTNGLDRFSEDVQKAVNYIRGENTLHPDSQDPGLIPEALQILDSVVALFLFLSSRAGKKIDLPVIFLEQIELLYLQITAADNEYSLLPLHRLIPLNTWRRDELNDIPEPYRYHFQWYELWCDLPEHIIGLLTLHWQEIVEDNNLDQLEIAEPLADELIRAIKKDKSFYRSLVRKNSMARKMTEVLTQSVPLGLTALSNIIPPKHLVHDEIAQKGFQGVACALINQAAASWMDKYERLLLAGLYGPDLDAARRMEIFKDITLWLDSKPRLQPGSLAQLVHSWQQDPLQCRSLLDSTMQQWQNKLLTVAQSMPGPVDYVAGAFDLAVTNLQNSQPVSLLDRAKNLADRLLGLIPTFELPKGEDLLDALASTGYPPRLATVYADSGNTECLMIRLTDTNQDQIDYLDVEQLEQEAQHGRTLVTGILVNPPDEDAVEDFSCRYLINEKSISPLFCEYHSGSFAAGFAEELPNRGELRIILVTGGSA